MANKTNIYILQMEALRKNLDIEGNPLQDNYRPTQELNNRKVYYYTGIISLIIQHRGTFSFSPLTQLYSIRVVSRDYVATKCSACCVVLGRHNISRRQPSPQIPLGYCIVDNSI